MGDQGKYTGEVVSQSQSEVQKARFNWSALVVWLISLSVSLMPLYIALIQHLIQTNGAITEDFWFACFKHHDILWVFATVLLFSIMNHFTIQRKVKKPKWVVMTLMCLGGLLFVLLETTWIIYKLYLSNFQQWAILLGFVLIGIAMIIATPLQIDFIKSEG